MWKKKLLILLQMLVALAIFNLLAWYLPFREEKAYWLGYGLVTFSIVELSILRYLIFGQTNVRNRFMHLPLSLTSIIGAVIFALLGIVFMFMPDVNIKFALVLTALIFLCNISCMLPYSIAAAEATGVEEKNFRKEVYLKTLEQSVRAAIYPGMDAQLKTEMEKLADDIRYSDPISRSNLHGIEKRIKAECALLCAHLEDTEAALKQCGVVRALIKQRNEQCMMLK